MKKIIAILLGMALATAVAWAQSLPQFTGSDFEGWTYNNPGIPLTSSNIAGGRVVLYTNSQGLVLTLVSPVFDCHNLDSIEASVVWYTSEFRNSSFDLSKAALTMALDSDDGEPLDSVTSEPAVMASTHNMVLKLAVPAETSLARLRFVSWKADIVSSGAIKRALISGIVASPQDDNPLRGDVDGNGVINITDVTILILGVLNSTDMPNGDVDGNGRVNVTDVTMLIDMALRH